MFQSLHERNYRNWFSGALVSNTGTWMQRTAQDWIVLTELTDNDATALGVGMALQLGPQLIMFPFAGSIVDRFDKRKLLIITQALMGINGFILFGLMLSGVIQLWHVYVLALALGLVSTVDSPARQSFVSELVGEKLVPNAVSLNSASFNGARMVGPGIAGVLTALIGAGPIFLIAGLGFAATILVLVTLDTSKLHPAARRPKGQGLKSITGGFSYLRTRPDIVVVLSVLFVVSTFGYNFNIFTSTMAKLEFHHDASGFGLLNSVMAIGSLAGALTAAKRERPRLRFIFAAAGGFGLATVSAALMPTYSAFAVTLIFVGFASITMSTAANAYVQTTTPGAVRGRVMAIYMAVVMGGAPIGAPFAGFIADWLGPRAAVLVGGISGVIGILIGVTWMVFAKNMRVHRARVHPRRIIHFTYDGHQ
ncbi:MFS transporter [Brevibacterium sp. 50QC2O2]|jgi:MFS family permease|uniref:MFS transporter n=1 Tax=Brevibacterium TaxID=1696 RepID=UPI00211BE500|nr:MULTISPECIES: MFS transporter [unclassified Brevibacterium]MCQ9369096.1 MFS transporter [Brevibacterium sp. 91QC2O2]MCQ9385072.1 MFS transporter [Brevibacterium sp. 68QC2CO]MCQ9387770.1 MFS transporter [Brevibacterium sp. 50QC2O2]